MTPKIILTAGLEMAGMGASAGQLLIRHTGSNERFRLVAIMVVAGVFTGLLGMNGAVAAMLPIIVVVSVRTAMALVSGLRTDSSGGSARLWMASPSHASMANAAT